ncbi:acetyl-CoA synthetase-like protein [Aspergillus fijiensis CBS 313.89]|uniref:Acetyl-CoA synthetase-like protein n=1 Tax=Aspergillus fijiensis CBS 313.89 TaxID=1448319 RepID=A0A8G1RVK0_9EURO|nr:acetyl-CoA synthetase-like protein [Aspergillus fijiensis CBS 313.89]RAK80872.1 acetyl-CoA synthetase-like protein [Aspergillus fijiensis CBS 313.89]
MTISIQTTGKESDHTTVPQHDAHKDNAAPKVRLSHPANLPGVAPEKLEAHALSAWALLLHFYNRQDNVAFLFLRNEAQQEDTSTTKSIASHQVSYDIHEDKTLQELLDSLSNVNKATSPESQQSMSAVYIDQSEDTPLEEVVAEHKNQMIASLHPTKMEVTARIYSHAREPSADLSAVVEAYKNIWKAMTDMPSSKIAHLNLATEYDIKQFKKWHADLTPRSPETIHGLINRYYRSSPGDIAIRSTTEKLTFQQLGEMSAAIAHELAAKGIKPGSRVAVYLEKSAWAIVVIIGVLRAGAALIPLDASCPGDRLAYIAQKTEIQALITQTKLTDIISESIRQNIEIITLSSLMQLQAPEGWHTETANDPWQVAYIMFTSGSTGKPKGVVHIHQAVAGGLQDVTEALHMGSDTPQLQYASFSFDASILEIFGPLIVGGTVCVPSPEEKVEDLQSVMRKLEVTDATLTPAVVAQLEPASLPSLREISIGGDAPSSNILRNWSRHVTLNNLYGTTETSVWDTIKTGMKSGDHPQSIGRGIRANCWVVDPDNVERLLPIGAIGELLIQSPYIGKGYLDEPDQTSSAFIETPKWYAHFQDTAGFPMYRTGDLAKLDAEGDAIFIGRESGFVKIRGMRVELTEIERVIESVIAPRKAAVVLASVDGKEENQEIMAYVETPHDIIPSLADDMHAALKGQLPSYMIPTVFIPIGSIPLTESKKKDRQLDILDELKHILPQINLAPHHTKKTIFVTSITGFLGSQVLRCLLADPNVGHIIGLVRAKEISEAEQKIQYHAEIGDWWTGSLDPRVEIWLGDLSKKKLGLSAEKWKCLTGELSETRIDGIIHSGARVNWLDSYESLRPTNVDSTVEVLSAVAMRSSPCALTYVSGGYLPAADESKKDIARKLEHASGYDQTKMLSRLLVEQYNDNVYRLEDPYLPTAQTIQPGYIVGTRTEGVAHTEDFLWRLASSILSLGAISEDLTDAHIPVAGVDQIARLVVESTTRRAPQSKSDVDCWDGLTLGELCAVLQRETGITVKTMLHDEWMRALSSDVSSRSDHPFLPVLQWFEDNQWQFASNVVDGSHEPVFEREEIVEAIVRSVSYLVEIGFLPCKYKREEPEGCGKMPIFKRSN